MPSGGNGVPGRLTLKVVNCHWYVRPRARLSAVVSSARSSTVWVRLTIRGPEGRMRIRRASGSHDTDAGIRIVSTRRRTLCSFTVAGSSATANWAQISVSSGTPMLRAGG